MDKGQMEACYRSIMYSLFNYRIMCEPIKEVILDMRKFVEKYGVKNRDLMQQKLEKWDEIKVELTYPNLFLVTVDKKADWMKLLKDTYEDIDFMEQE